MNNRLIDLYKKEFKSNPEKYFMSPCRINLIGEHTDYNAGLVLPAAISKYIHAVVGKRNDKKIHLKSLNKLGDVEVDLDNISNSPENKWGNYPLGIFATLQKRGYKLPFGLNIIYSSNVPIASGLSSSASMLDLTAFIASIMYNIPLPNDEIALLAHQSETEFNGLQCGIMDEFAIALGKKNKCIFLDCGTNKFTYEDVDFKDLSLVVIVSNVKRALIASPYNQRVAECNKSLDILKKHFSIKSLSDLKVSDLDECKKLLSNDILYRRTKHVVTSSAVCGAIFTGLSSASKSPFWIALHSATMVLRASTKRSSSSFDSLSVGSTIRVSWTGKLRVGAWKPKSMSLLATSVASTPNSALKLRRSIMHSWATRPVVPV